jgi:endonuclease/exonuclease/phosphatase family metal-dependent hydrolase
VTVASLNVLHGIFCPGGTSGCRRADRLALVRDWVVARGCPDVLAFQEVFDISATNENADTLRTLLSTACPAPYVAVYRGANTVDDEMIFSRYPLLIDEILDLLGPLRNVLHVRIDHPIGPLDVYATHLASGSDSATSPCAGTFGPCPAECVAAAASTVRECQAVQMARHIETTHDVPTLALALGDFNAEPGSFEHAQFASRGWTDTYLAAGNPECVPATGIGCTSGRIDDALTDMESPAPNQVERIDYVWLIPAAPGSLCAGTTEPAGDPDGDGVATRLFADVPNPFAPSCGPAPDAICWGSDHSGTQADVNCP